MSNTNEKSLEPQSANMAELQPDLQELTPEEAGEVQGGLNFANNLHAGELNFTNNLRSGELNFTNNLQPTSP